jgi:predicted O-methyltransferase YrrM
MPGAAWGGAVTDQPTVDATDRRAYFEALAAVTAALSRAEVLGLVRGAWRSGLIEALVEGGDVASLAVATGLPEGRVADLCVALDAHEIADLDGSTYRLHPRWGAVAVPGGFVTLDAVLDISVVRTRLLEVIASGGHDFWAHPGDRLAYARGVSPDPMAPESVAALRRSLETCEPLIERLRAGGRYLELGCGVAGNLCAMLQSFPGIRAVGVELSDELAAEARRRGEVLGIADRLEVVCADATEVDWPEEFDLVFWSQMFFPAETRAPALAAAHRCLRRGGMVMAPAIEVSEVLEHDRRSDEGRELALDRVIHAAWGVPVRPVEDLLAEVAEAGFLDVQVADREISKLVIGYRP